MRAPAVVIALAIGLAGCLAPATRTGWLDRPWIDSGCDASGACRMRGRLTLAEDGAAALELVDGQLLTARVPPEVLARREHWNGRVVAARGRLAADGGLDIARLSLKGAQ